MTVDPEIVATIAGFDDELLGNLGDREVSIENSVAFRKGVVYFANSGGLVQGWDISDLLGGRHLLQPGVPVLGGRRRRCLDRAGLEGVPLRGGRVPAVQRALPGDRSAHEARSEAARTIRWSGASMRARSASRGRGAVGRRRPSTVRPSCSRPRPDGCSWSIACRAQIAHELSVGAPSIASPVVVDGVLILGDCLGDLYAWDMADPGVEPAAAVDDGLRGLHRVHAGRVARMALPGHPGGLPVRHRRSARRRLRTRCPGPRPSRCGSDRCAPPRSRR